MSRDVEAAISNGCGHPITCCRCPVVLRVGMPPLSAGPQFLRDIRQSLHIPRQRKTALCYLSRLRSGPPIRTRSSREGQERPRHRLALDSRLIVGCSRSPATQVAKTESDMGSQTTRSQRTREAISWSAGRYHEIHKRPGSPQQIQRSDRWQSHRAVFRLRGG